MAFLRNLFRKPPSQSPAPPQQAGPVYRVLPFGDKWCVVFSPTDEVKGLCAVCATQDVADNVATNLLALPSSVQILVSIPQEDDPPSVIPCVRFTLVESGQAKTLDWFGGRVLRQPVPTVLDGNATDSPVLDLMSLQQYFPSARPYPQSLKELTDLLLSARRPTGVPGEFSADLEKICGTDEQERRSAEAHLLSGGSPALQALKEIARDVTVRLRLRKAAIYYATQFSNQDIGPFLAEFVNGKNISTLRLASDQGDDKAEAELAMFFEVKSHLEKLGYHLGSVK